MYFPLDHFRSFALQPQQQDKIKSKRPNKELSFRYNEMSSYQSYRNQLQQRKPFTTSKLQSPEFQKKVAKIFKCLKSHGSKRNNQTQQLIRLCIETLRLSQRSRQLQRQIDQLKLETKKFLEIVKPSQLKSSGGPASAWISSMPTSSFSVHTQQHRFSYPGSTDGKVDGSVNHVMYNTRLTSMRLEQPQAHPIPPAPGTPIKPSPVSARPAQALTALPLQSPQTTITVLPLPVKPGTAVPGPVPASPASDSVEIDDVQEPLMKVMKLQQEDPETSMDFRESSDASSSFSGGSSTSTCWSSNETQSSSVDQQESTASRGKKSECSCCKDEMSDTNALDFHSYLNRRAKLWIHSVKLKESMSLDTMPFNSLRPDGCGGGGYSRIDDERLIDAVVASKPAKKAKKVIKVSGILEQNDNSTSSSFSSLDSIADCSSKSLSSLGR